MPARQRILFVSPYATWHYHTAQEITLALGLVERGKQVLFALCDGLFPVCDVYRANLNPRPADGCAQCRARVEATFAQVDLPRAWLSRYVPAQLRERIGAWAAALSARELVCARWRDWPVGEWALSSAMYQFRLSELELGDGRVLATLRAQVLGCALAAEAFDALFDEFRPDAVALLNGRFFAHRAAVELARARGIPFHAHERGMNQDSLTWRSDAIIHELAPYAELWQAWRDVPLAAAGVERVAAELEQRRAGKGMSWLPYSPPPQDQAELRRRLDLGERPVVAIFTSSDDEIAAFPDWCAGAFPRALDWLPRTLRIAAQHPEHVFVVRLHPALVSCGRNEQALELARACLAQLPPNCRVVQPDEDVSSYTLADMAELGLVSITTMGLEMAARGQRVITPARGWYGHSSAVDWAQTPQDYERAIAQALARPGRSLERARGAYRFLHAYWERFQQRFPLVHEHPRGHGALRYRTRADLRPGADAALDQACAMLGEGAPAWPGPEPAERLRDAELETALLASRVPGIEQRPAGAAARLLGAAEQAFARGEAQDSRLLLEALLRLEPAHARAWNDLGVVRLALGEAQPALECWQRALALDPRQADALANLATLGAGC